MLAGGAPGAPRSWASTYAQVRLTLGLAKLTLTLTLTLAVALALALTLTLAVALAVAVAVAVAVALSLTHAQGRPMAVEPLHGQLHGPPPQEALGSLSAAELGRGASAMETEMTPIPDTDVV